MSRYPKITYPDKSCSHAYSMTFHPEFAHCSSCDTFWRWWVTDSGHIKGWHCIPSYEGHSRFRSLL